MATVHIESTDQFTKEVKEFDGVVLVDFYADRCGPCKMLAPIMEQLSEDFTDKNVKIIKVNTDENNELAQEYGIMSIPAVYPFKKGEHQEPIVGVQPKEVYENKINELLENDD